MFKKLIVVLVSILVLVGCSSNETPDDFSNNGLEKIVVGASIVPHSEILEFVSDDLKAKGYELVVVEYDDYVQPNLALDKGDLDANYFQHQPYLDSFNSDHNLTLVGVAKIHYEPFGIYQGNKTSLSDLSDGDKISVPNDATNEARALALLEQEGLIKVREGAGLNATKLDIVENPLNLDIVELEAAQLAKSIEDVAFSVINGNYALQGGLTSATVVAFESSQSVGAETYANVIAVREGDVDSEKTKALIEVLTAQKVKDYIKETYDGAVEASF